MAEDKQLNKKVQSPLQMMQSRLNGLAPHTPPALAAVYSCFADIPTSVI